MKIMKTMQARKLHLNKYTFVILLHVKRHTPVHFSENSAHVFRNISTTKCTIKN